MNNLSDRDSNNVRDIDRGICIAWYDIAPPQRAEYLAWLHQTYIPLMLKRPGVLWAAHYACIADPPYSGKKGRLTRTDDASVPAGTQFMLLFGAHEPHVFADPITEQCDASLPEADRRILALRSGERRAIFAEQARVDGSNASPAETPLTLSPCVQLGSFNSRDWRDEEELAAWYARWYLPATQHIQGCVRTRKLVSVAGWAKHAIIFEFTSLDARNKNFVNHDNTNTEMEAWTDKVVRRLIHAPGSPAVAQRVWPAVE